MSKQKFDVTRKIYTMNLKSQHTINCSKSTIETLENGAKNDQS